MLLELEDVVVAYGRIEALHGISIGIDEGEVVALIGANGAGKTTTMRAISGLRPLSAGRIRFDGEDISRLRADLRVRRGLCQSPEGRGIFPGMTVMENLDMGAYTRRDTRAVATDLERRLLARGYTEHTPSGRHVRFLETWRAWARRRGIARADWPGAAEAIQALSAPVTAWPWANGRRPPGLLPWISAR